MNGNDQAAAHISVNADGRLFSSLNLFTPIDYAFPGPFYVNATFSLAGNGYGLSARRVTSNVVTGAVPEPASWAMMVGGFGLAGAVMRRRRFEVRFA